MKTLTQALGHAVPLAALIAAQTALAQEVTGDTEVTVSMTIVDGPDPDAVQINVLKQPDFGEIVRPRGEVQCTYAVFSSGTTSVSANQFDPNTGLPTPVDNSGCEFVSGATPPDIEISCEEGRQISLFGRLNEASKRITAQIGSGGSTGGNTVSCEANAFSIEPAISIRLSATSELGTQALVLPFEVTFE